MLLSARGAGDRYGGGAEQSGPLPPRLHRQVHGGQSGRCHGDYFLHGAEQRERSVGGGTLTSPHPHLHTLTSTLPHLSTPSQACVEDDIGQLSASIPSLHAIGQTDDQIADTHSSLSSRSHSIDYETTPTPEKPSDDPKSLNAAEFVTPNGPLRQNSNQTSLGPGGLLSSQFNPHSPHHTHTSSPLHAHTNGHTDEVSSSSGTARSGALVMPKGDELFFEDEVPFCDCPPDPEIPRGLNLQHLT